MRPLVVTRAPLAGTSLIEASAGTGKTHALSTLFVRVLLARQLTVDKILVVTFTEAATAELRDRVRRRLREALAAFEARTKNATFEGFDDDLIALSGAVAEPEQAIRRLRLALDDVDCAPISTIHGFCQRALYETAFASGVPFDLEVLPDARPVLEDVVRDFWTREGIVRPEVLMRRLMPKDRQGAINSVNLLQRTLRDPSMPVLTSEGELPELDTGPLRRAWEDARACFDGPRISRLLGMLKGVRAGTIDRAVAEMQSWLAEPPALPIPERAKNLSARFIGEKARGSAPAHAFFDACDRLLDAAEALAALLDRHEVAFRRRLIEHGRREVPQRQAAAGTVSFDGLLLELRDALAGPGGDQLAEHLCAARPVALIDEFQDTDPVQWEIFRRIHDRAGSTLYLVGDPKQAIYSFRGADVFTYLDAAQRVPDEQRFTLGINWRSDPRMLRAVRALFERAHRPFAIDEIGVPPVEPRPNARERFGAGPGVSDAALEILTITARDGKPQASAIPALVAAEISSLLRSGSRIDGQPIVAGDVAVLTRKNVQCMEVQAALAALGVRSVVLGDASVFAQETATELGRVLAATAEPGNPATLRAALATTLLGVSANEIVDLGSDAAGWEGWVLDFRHWNAVWRDRGVVPMLRALMQTRAVAQRLLALPDGERRMTDVLHLMELLHHEERDRHLGPAGLVHWLQTQRSSTYGVAADVAQIRLESDDRAVKITTVHRSKGLEYPIVYAPYLWAPADLFPEEKRDLTFHDEADAHRMKLDLDPGSAERAQHLGQAEKESLAEALRLTYVALTRARHRTTLVWGRFFGFEKSALGYLLFQQWPLGRPDEKDRQEQIKSRNSEQVLAELRDLEIKSEGCIASRDVSGDAPGETVPPPDEPEPSLARRELKRRVENWWRTTSFSALTSKSAEQNADPSDGHDRDETAVKAAAEAEAGPVIALDGFPRGARSGTLLHAVLEKHDFGTTDAAALPALCAEQLALHGYPVEPWRDRVAQALDDVLDTPLADGLCLRALPRQARVPELEFWLPVATAAADDPLPADDAAPRASRRRPTRQLQLDFTPARFPIGHVTREKLAAAFREHPSTALATGYADTVGRLQFLPLRGWLKGYIDLVFAHAGHYYVVDYKTNHLGDRLGAYAAARLPAAMAHGHYYLQSHLYATAVHRWLALRIPGYDYDRHFGGVYYLFLKGMTPATGAASGVFFEKPPRARIEALATLLERPRGEDRA